MRLLVLLFALLTTVACSSSQPAVVPDLVVEHHTDAKTNFDGIKTYRIVAAAGAINDPNGKWHSPNVDFGNDLKFLIERELRDRGLTPVADQADVDVIFLVAVDMEALKVVKERHDGQDEEVLKTTPQGAIVVQMVDTETLKAVWTAGAAAEVNERPEAEEARKRIDYAVSELFKTYPKGK